MEEMDNDLVLAFDHFYTTNHIQILKSLLPFMGNDSFSMLPALIKYMELQYTLSLISKGNKSYTDGIRACSAPSGPAPATDPAENIEKIYKAVHRYLTPNEEKSFQQMVSAVQTMKNIREMQQMMDLFQSLNPDMDPMSMMENLSPGGAKGGGMDLSEIMKIFGGNPNGNK